MNFTNCYPYQEFSQRLVWKSFVTAQYLSSYEATGNALRAFQIACGLACQLLFYAACSGVQAAVLSRYNLSLGHFAPYCYYSWIPNP